MLKVVRFRTFGSFKFIGTADQLIEAVATSLAKIKKDAPKYKFVQWLENADGVLTVDAQTRSSLTAIHGAINAKSADEFLTIPTSQRRAVKRRPTIAQDVIIEAQDVVIETSLLMVVAPASV
jgi:hypothetical protein